MKRIVNLFLFILLAASVLTSCGDEEVNEFPRIISWEYSPNHNFNNDTITFTCFAEDKNGDDISFSWRAEKGTIIDYANNTMRYKAFSGFEGYDTVYVKFRINLAPTIHPGMSYIYKISRFILLRTNSCLIHFPF